MLGVMSAQKFIRPDGSMKTTSKASWNSPSVGTPEHGCFTLDMVIPSVLHLDWAIHMKRRTEIPLVTLSNG